MLEEMTIKLLKIRPKVMSNKAKIMRYSESHGSAASLVNEVEACDEDAMN